MVEDKTFIPPSEFPRNELATSLGTVVLTNERVAAPLKSSNTYRAELIEQMSTGGYTQLVGNERLETSLIRYRAALLDERYGEEKDYARFEQLTEHEQAQARSMVEELARADVAPASILNERLMHTRVLRRDSHSVRGKEVGGENTSDGLAIVARNIRPAAAQNHALLHEIGHGLVAPTTIFWQGDSVRIRNKGLMHRQAIPPATSSTLHTAEEALIDTLALSVSDIETGAYLRGEIPDVVMYRDIDNSLSKFTADHPNVARALWEGVFYAGVQYPAGMIQIADTLKPYLLS